MSGKYDSRIAEYLHYQSLEGSHDAEIGDVAGLGWFGVFRTDRSPMSLKVSDIVAIGLDSEEVRTIHTMSGAILSEDNDGFVTAQTFSDPTELESAWSIIEDEYSIFDGPDDESDDILVGNLAD